MFGDCVLLEQCLKQYYIVFFVSKQKAKVTSVTAVEHCARVSSFVCEI